MPGPHVRLTWQRINSREVTRLWHFVEYFVCTHNTYSVGPALLRRCCPSVCTLTSSTPPLRAASLDTATRPRHGRPPRPDGRRRARQLVPSSGSAVHRLPAASRGGGSIVAGRKGTQKQADRTNREPRRRPAAGQGRSIRLRTAMLRATLAAGSRLAIDLPRLPTLGIRLFPTSSESKSPPLEEPSCATPCRARRCSARAARQHLAVGYGRVRRRQSSRSTP